MELQRRKSLIRWLALSWTISQATPLNRTASWTKLVSSSNYRNTKLVLESETWNQTQNISTASSIMAAMVSCSQICDSKATCLSFNFYPTATQYVCEFLVENFCSHRQRIALQAWPGGTVWDKVIPGVKTACIDQQFENQTAAIYCERGRSGCRSNWPNCDICVRSCGDCVDTYNYTNEFNCTMWPEGAFENPIFGFCKMTSIALVKRGVNLAKGTVWPDYRMSFLEMFQLCKLNIYKTLVFTFEASDGTVYTSVYENFLILPSGTITGMTFKAGNGGDAFNAGTNPLASTIFAWVNVPLNYCGSFWLINATGTWSRLNCPGYYYNSISGYGNYVSMFGYVNSLYNYTGIYWPQASMDGKILVYVDLKLYP